jgi:hypothetical protein
MIVRRQVSRLIKWDDKGLCGVDDFMMYWFGVYGLVIVGGLTPFVLLYLFSLALWGTFGAARSVLQTLKHTLAVRKTSLTALSQRFRNINNPSKTRRALQRPSFYLRLPIYRHPEQLLKQKHRDTKGAENTGKLSLCSLCLCVLN